MDRGWEALLAREILFVSGKGGTGKSTVAAALATAAAATGRQVLLAEVEGRGEMTRTLGIPDPGFEERPTPLGFSALSITPQAAALEYLRLFVGLDRVTRTLLRTGVLDQLIGAAPGFRDVLASGKLYEVTRVRRELARDRGRPRYDLVIVDAPPTGQIASFLSAPAAYADLVRVGRVQRQVRSIRRLLQDRASVALVTTLEEMAVAETLESIGAIRATGVPVTGIVANRHLDQVVPRGLRAVFDALTPEAVRRVAAGTGPGEDLGTAVRLLDLARTSDGRHRVQGRFLTELRRSGIPLRILPEASPGSEAVARLAAIVSGVPPRAPARGPEGGSGGADVSGPVPEPGLDAPLTGARIVVVCGSGGVGKTTTSAAIALHLAEKGRRTILLTVDPARRLATALRLPRTAGDRTTVPIGRGRHLEAVQLDTQRTFDELVARYAGSPARRDRILENRFYRRIADTLAGTHEYMAMEKLGELAEEEDHEAIVVDTPPTRSALSFLDAPNRMTDFLGGRLLRWMLWPSARLGRLSMGVARFGAAAFIGAAGRLVGAQTLADAADFLREFEGMYAGFKDRAARVLERMSAPDCAFVVVTAPTETSLVEAGYFVERLSQNGMRPAAAVANRWRGAAQPVPVGFRRALPDLRSGPPEQRAVAAVLDEAVRLEPELVAEAHAMDEFAARHGSVPIVGVPDLPGDIHDVPGLRRISAELFRPAAD